MPPASLVLRLLRAADHREDCVLVRRRSRQKQPKNFGQGLSCNEILTIVNGLKVIMSY